MYKMRKIHFKNKRHNLTTSKVLNLIFNFNFSSQQLFIKCPWSLFLCEWEKIAGRGTQSGWGIRNTLPMPTTENINVAKLKGTGGQWQ